MNIGELDKRVTLRSFTTTTNAENFPDRTYSDVATVWARLVPLRGMESQENEKKTVTRKRVFEIRYRTDVDEKMVLVYNNKEHQVIYVEEIGRKDRLRIETELKL
ncbi:phage head closure protein [Sanyastnella coralliicola]|uniref:phage head closure protein n=1 Tax=Sanyastnella coralliicola TaxID=3069118 RepID=UPI0027B8C566|nr:phage head closure protein [Longitalea sp. SCSIO 12813]